MYVCIMCMCVTEREKVRKINRLYSAKTTTGGRDGFLGTFGDQTDFFEGLEAFNGRPMVADDAALFEKMRDEFERCTDSRVKNIYASNYKISTNVRWPFPAPVHPNAHTFTHTFSFQHHHIGSRQLSLDPKPQTLKAKP